MTKPYFSNFNRFMSVFRNLGFVCIMSHKSTVRLITSVGKDHDRKVIEWQNKLKTVLSAEVKSYYQHCDVSKYYELFNTL